MRNGRRGSQTVIKTPSRDAVRVRSESASRRVSARRVGTACADWRARAFRMAVLVVLAGVLTGCVSVNRSILSRSRMTAPVPRDAVQVYFADDSIPQHERIAILNARGDESLTNEGQMIDRLREEAGKLGANAIILDQLRDPSTGERVIAAIFGGSAQRRGQALAIYVLASSPPDGT